jgi:hypothetical protein
MTTGKPAAGRLQAFNFQGWITWSQIATRFVMCFEQLKSQAVTRTTM